MASESDADTRPIQGRDQLIEYFRQGEKSEDERGIGTEHEKFVLRRDDLSMIAHDGDRGIEAIFEGLVEQFDWEPVREDGRIISLERGAARVTLEPGGQLELSGAITDTVQETEAELDEHFRELDEVARDDHYFTCWGMNPFYRPDEVPMVPKQRYDIMRSYLPSRGELSPWMMKTSCTIQANYDYTSEQDATDLVRTALLVSPIISAIFANSPYCGGRDSGMQTYRGHAWTKTDPDRTGWPAFMYRDDWGYEQYLDYMLDIPMFFVRREGRLIPMIGWTFREFIEDDRGRFDPQMRDFVLHLSTAFPEIRMKQFVEVRGADGGPRSHMLALPAVWKGILYDSQARREAAELLEELEPDEHARLFHDVYEKGLEASCRAGDVQTLADRLLTSATGGLERLASRYDHDSEAPYLEPLREVVDTGRTLADQLRDDLEACGGDRRKIVEKWALF